MQFEAKFMIVTILKFPKTGELENETTIQWHVHPVIFYQNYWNWTTTFKIIIGG